MGEKRNLRILLSFNASVPRGELNMARRVVAKVEFTLGSCFRAQGSS
jgi:hypothetical protein